MRDDAYITHENDETKIMTIRTKPCWICGQHSRIDLPWDAAIKWDQGLESMDTAWPEGSADDKQLLRTGIHPACWDQEFPSHNEEN